MSRIDTHLAPVPDPIRSRMLADRSALAPGAAAVMGRFFATLATRGEPLEAPSENAFRAAAASESTLATLLRSLTRYAPEVSTAAGRQLRKEHYRTRPGRSPTRSGSCTPALPPTAAPPDWPSAWRALYPGLRAAPIRESSLRRYIASIQRCADTLTRLDLPESVATRPPAFYLGHCLAVRLSSEGVRDRTIATYLDGLVALLRHGGAEPVALSALRSIRNHHFALSKGHEKLKHERLRGLIEAGGYEHLVRTVASLRIDAGARPGHSAEAERLRQKSALLAIHINKPARTADVAGWVLGRELVRHPDGSWVLHWTQKKTGVETGAGALWREVGEILDELILAGRPKRLAHLLYGQQEGRNWLTRENDSPAAGWPSQLVQEAIGVPSQDLRTLAADYMRWHSPETAAGVIESHLGHNSTEAGEAYRALAEGDAAAQEWQRIRKRLADQDVFGLHPNRVPREGSRRRRNSVPSASLASR